MNHFTYCVPCLFGLEGLVGDELRRMDAENVRVENGHVYAAQPPLYKVSGKGIQDTYLYDDKALEEFRAGYNGKFELQRYKGLGEMNKEQLWETTMDPARRTLVRINVEDAVEADKMFALLMGEQPELRRKFIEENAKLVEELDV